MFWLAVITQVAIFNYAKFLQCIQGDSGPFAKMYTLFSLNFASTKFRDFEKLAKFNTHELQDTKIKIAKKTKLPTEDSFSDVGVEYGPAYI